MQSDASRPDSLADRGRIDWDAAWREHTRWLRTVIASRLGEAGAVDDVLQQVGLAVARVDGRPTELDRVAPWLYRVAVKQCLMHRRTAGRRRRFLQSVQEQSGAGDDGEDASPLGWLLREERIAAAAAALRDLPELERQLLLLKHSENWTYRQLADHLGVSVNTIEYRLLQARDRLRRRLIQSGVEEVTA